MSVVLFMSRLGLRATRGG